MDVNTICNYGALKTGFGQRESGAESDSSACAVSVSSTRVTRSTFKRPRVEEGQGQSSSSNVLEAPAPPKIATAARGRGKRSKRSAATARCEPTELGGAPPGSWEEIPGCWSCTAEVGGDRNHGGVFNVCRVPSAGKVHQGLAEMRRELARLSASNAALEAELRLTKAELAVCRSQPHPSAEPDFLGLMRREMAAFRQRFDVLESRLLRPPLAASRSPTSTSYAAVAAGPPTTSGRVSQPVARPRAAPPARTPAPPALKEPQPRASLPRQQELLIVASGRLSVRRGKSPKRRGSAAKKAQRQRRQQQRKEKRAAALLLAPKTAAVVITLQPDAVKRGVTYGDVLAKVKGAVTPAEFGAPDGFTMKVTATGARLLEVPGAASGSSADALAERLRTCLGVDEARVSRPIKCLDLRILGLDDSATEYEVVAAVARTGGCPVDQVKAGTIRPDNSGLRTVVDSEIKTNDNCHLFH
ncbi:hypothetical protein SFRURICE_003386 [Spodoptera frugiperda]|nr:hypothetical protein SFRURICE_003386 [Spodoptera frugiperda]